jgi:hypothetical protein
MLPAMKTFVLLLITSLALTAAEPPVDVSGYYSGGIISTRCPAPVGGQITLEAIVGVQVRVRVVDDGVEVLNILAPMDQYGRFVATRFSDNTTLIGRVRLRGNYFIFTGRGRDDTCRYKFQGRYRRATP